MKDSLASSRVPILFASGRSPIRKISSATTPQAATAKAAIWAIVLAPGRDPDHEHHQREDREHQGRVAVLVGGV